MPIASILEFYANCSRCLDRLLGQTGAVGKQHASRIGFSVAANINSNVVVFNFLVWSQSRLLCYVGSASNAAAALGDAFIRIIGKHPAMQESYRLRPESSMPLQQRPQYMYIYFLSQTEFSSFRISDTLLWTQLRLKSAKFLQHYSFTSYPTLASSLSLPSSQNS